MKWANTDRADFGAEQRARNPIRGATANSAGASAERSARPSAFRPQERVIEPDEELARLCPMCESRYIRFVVTLTNSTVYTCDTCRGAFTITTDHGQSAVRREAGRAG
jgi:hypothetical protein